MTIPHIPYDDHGTTRRVFCFRECNYVKHGSDCDRHNLYNFFWLNNFLLKCRAPRQKIIPKSKTRKEMMVWVNAEPGQANTDAGLARRSTVLDSVMDSRYGDTGLEKTQEQHPLQGAKIHSKDFAA